MLYQLGEYNSKQNLSEQSEQIRNHVILQHDFQSINNLIDDYTRLEFESIVILNKAINAGYWNSLYGFNWKPEEEIQFWTKVKDKSEGVIIGRLQLLRTLQSSGKQNVEDLKLEYIEILNKNPSLYYEFISEDLNNVWKNDEEIKQAILKAMFIHLSDDMSLSEFEEEVRFQTEIHYAQTGLPTIIGETVNKIKKEKAGNKR